MKTPETYADYTAAIEAAQEKLLALKDKANPRTNGAQARLLRKIHELTEARKNAPVVEDEQ